MVTPEVLITNHFISNYQDNVSRASNSCPEILYSTKLRNSIPFSYNCSLIKL
jgi:hypothetical protein